MTFGDGAIVRKVLGAFVSFLHDFAAPTGARGSILFMAGGLVVLGFLFLAFLFRSAIVGDLAPVANARAPIPRVALPPHADAPVTPKPAAKPAAKAAAAAPAKTAAAPGPADFTTGRKQGREGAEALDGVFDVLRAQGSEARILESGALRKRIRVYRCASCASGRPGGCEHERGILAGGFEALTGDLAKVHETACKAAGAPYCEFEVQHAPLRRPA